MSNLKLLLTYATNLRKLLQIKQILRKPVLEYPPTNPKECPIIHTAIKINYTKKEEVASIKSDRGSNQNYYEIVRVTVMIFSV